MLQQSVNVNINSRRKNLKVTQHMWRKNTKKPYKTNHKKIKIPEEKFWKKNENWQFNKDGTKEVLLQNNFKKVWEWVAWGKEQKWSQSKWLGGVVGMTRAFLVTIPGMMSRNPTGSHHYLHTPGETIQTNLLHVLVMILRQYSLRLGP